MIKDRRERKIAILALCVSIVCLSVAYASLTQTLNITGNTVVQGNSWNIEFTGPVVVNKTGTAIATTSNVTLESTTITINNVKLIAPGDRVEILFNVKNSGNINAKLSQISNLTPNFRGTGDEKIADENLVSTSYEYTLQCYNAENLTYGICEMDTVLNASESMPMKIIIDFDANAISSPIADVTVSNFGSTLVFVQD